MNSDSILRSWSEIKTAYSKNSKVSNILLNDLKSSINKFFKDGVCKNVILTDNDKMFFGMCVMPVVRMTDLEKILYSDEPFRIKEYYIEIDSKLLNPTLDLNEDELTAITLHEIGHLINTSVPIEKVRKSLDVYMMETNDNLTKSKLEKTGELILFAIKDSVRKVTSMFENQNKEEILADEFVIRCGYGEYLLSALRKIERNALLINKDVPNKFVVLTWVLRLYANFNERKVAALHTLKKVKKTTSSKLVANEIDFITNTLTKTPVTEAEETREISRKNYKFKYDILRKYEDNYYEYALRLKSANVEEDALRLLREMNSRISVIEEFLDEVELTDPDRKRFTKLYNNYLELRDALGKKNIVKDRHLELWVEYPDF